jgi:hypothetical protein
MTNQNPNLLPAELTGNPRRQAVPSIRGTVFQAWCSIDAWLRLDNADQVIYLEGAEDFDVLNADGGITVQVKHTEATISLGTSKAIEALENFWQVSTKEAAREIDFHFLTTQTVAKESDSPFGDICGLEVWSAARTNVAMAMELTSYLKGRLAANSPLLAYLVSATPADIQARLFRRFFWITDQPGIDAIRNNVTERIQVLLHNRKSSVNLAPKVRVHLESRFWEIIVQPVSSDRRLTFSELLKQIEVATTAYLPVPMEELPDLLGSVRPGIGLLHLLLHNAPPPPDLLIERTEIIHSLNTSINQRRAVLLIGTVFKGKTTVAQLIAHSICPSAWWINLADREPAQVNNIFLALASEIEKGASPALIIVDDLDISPRAHRTYRDSFLLILLRAKQFGLAVLITAQGGTSDAANLNEFQGIQIIEIPELTPEEVIELCMRRGCPAAVAAFWGKFIHAMSRGHPKLVQIHVADLDVKRWPIPDATTFTGALTTTDSVRQIARRLLSESVSQEVAELLYVFSECSTLLHRQTAIELTNAICDSRNPGDVLDQLVGRWLECIEKNWFRTTPILSGAAAEAWSTERRANAHVQIHDAIKSKKNLSPAEGAALLYHAYFGKEPVRIARASMELQLIDNTEAKDLVKQHLLWLPYVALAETDILCADIMASVSLRSMQFQVAVTLDADTIPQICERWIEETARISHAQIRQGMQLIMWGSIANAENFKVPLGLRLDGIRALKTEHIPGEIADSWNANVAKLLKNIAPHSGIPATATTSQILLTMCTRWVRSLDTLHELFDWLDSRATEEIRGEFEQVLSWPIVQKMGAFVQGAWAATHADTKVWEPWLEVFKLIDSYAKRRSSPSIGREAAKAKAIILTEYLNRPDEALIAISDAEEAFGTSSILSEQRANVLYQSNDDDAVLKIWDELISRSESKTTLDVFAYRRAAISAGRLEKWDIAERIFRDAIDMGDAEHLLATTFGLRLDCALAMSHGGMPRKAAALVLEAIATLPANAADENDPQWEALQRAATEVIRQIDKAVWSKGASSKIHLGYASTPALCVEKSEPGQAMRTAMLKAEVAKLCAVLGISSNQLPSDELEILGKSAYPFVRWLSAEAFFSRSLANGAGAGFVRALITLDGTFETFLKLNGAMLTADVGENADIPNAPETWFGLLVAGLVCADFNILPHLDLWLEECRSLPARYKGLEKIIEEFKRGASVPVNELKNMVWNRNTPNSMRCGAAAMLLQDHLSPSERLLTQGLLTSALVSDKSYVCQELYNIHVAIRFSVAWEKVAENPFLLAAPRASVPILKAAIFQVRASTGTLQRLLLAACEALGQSLGDFMDRVR